MLEGQRPGNKPAQGNALGNRISTGKALKGRDNLCRPFRALFGERRTQGVALGWLVAAPSVLVAASARTFIQSWRECASVQSRLAAATLVPQSSRTFPRENHDIRYRKIVRTQRRGFFPRDIHQPRDFERASECR